MIVDSEKTGDMPAKRIISGLECKNRNRILSTSCSISQSYDLSRTTSFSWSAEDTSETSTFDEFSWGRDVTQEDSTSDEFSFGFDQSITVGTEVEGLIASGSVEISVGANQQWTSTKDRTESETISEGKSWGGGTSNSATTGEEQSFETTDTVSITCEGSMDVPAGHSVTCMQYIYYHVHKSKHNVKYTQIR